MNKILKNTQLAAATEGDPRWASVVARDPEADGTFYYSVKSTGVYCRPSCAARRARPENVSFHMRREDAENAGLRPCKRCKPNQASLVEQYAANVTKACRLIEESEKVPSLEELANHAGMSRYHFHRVFKTVAGLTPRGYAAAHRAKRVRKSGCAARCRRARPRPGCRNPRPSAGRRPRCYDRASSHRRRRRPAKRAAARRYAARW
jgi:AraC family transcriptional regulator, regulatory protein of adaptative response / methylated-DNA-[protein]-cysteine methyltransferase